MTDRYSPDSEARFLGDTTEHVMEVLHDDGLYRHLRFHKPGTGLYWYDLITWPGSLTIHGDMGTYTFSRVADMFGFFRGDYINTSYWAEKCTAVDRNSGIKQYDEDKARKHVLQKIDDFLTADGEDEADPEYADLWGRVAEEVLDEDVIYHEDTFRPALNRFRHGRFAFHDTWDWDLTDYTTQYLWCCHAIRHGIAQYDAAKAVAA